ncbi:uncharacterized protein with TBP-like fold DUF4468 [Mucilaginibacter yixingensis]|uniref:Uncharacterized protein with TBP-like fold DUF4468 n=2 Tax=Mucilaginibacter yixingensis TaxID=1295612 RepID=A0A2T5JG56_9SPHI|nr:uncharacterized protein with TBP-like fold DUF4468 [Mucilaginibacter yixingensis]
MAILFFVVKAQEPDLTYEYSGNPYYFSEIVKVDSAQLKSNLYAKSIQWFALTFKDSKSVLQMQDERNGLVIGKGTFPFQTTSGTKYYPGTIEYVTFTIKIQVKDGKYKYEISDYNVAGYGLIKDGVITKYPKVPFMAKKIHDLADKNFLSLQASVKANAELISSSLKNAMNKPLNDSF